MWSQLLIFLCRGQDLLSLDKEGCSWNWQVYQRSIAFHATQVLNILSLLLMIKVYTFTDFSRTLLNRLIIELFFLNLVSFIWFFPWFHDLSLFCSTISWNIMIPFISNFFNSSRGLANSWFQYMIQIHWRRAFSYIKLFNWRLRKVPYTCIAAINLLFFVGKGGCRASGTSPSTFENDRWIALWLFNFSFFNFNKVFLGIIEWCQFWMRKLEHWLQRLSWVQ